MKKESLTTVNLLWQESINLFHSRNPFPSGGIYEDAATGAAAAAFAGYLRDIQYKVIIVLKSFKERIWDALLDY